MKFIKNSGLPVKNQSSLIKKQQIIKISSDRGNFLISLVDAFDKIINLMKETDGMKRQLVCQKRIKDYLVKEKAIFLPF